MWSEAEPDGIGGEVGNFGGEEIYGRKSLFNRGSRVGVLVAKITSSSRTRIGVEIRFNLLRE